MSTKFIVSFLILLGGLFIARSAQVQVAISEEGVVFPDDTEPVWALKRYELRDRGPGGGWVFYVTDDGLHGLEAAPTDNPFDRLWGCVGTNIPGAGGTAVGTGARNTEDIVRSCTENNIAADVADGFNSANGYFDWYLPSQAELDLMNSRLADYGVGNFSYERYWSSTEISATAAYGIDIPDISSGAYNKGTANRVRAVRAF